MNCSWDEFLKGLKNKKIIICGIGISNAPILKTFCRAGSKIIAYDKKTESEVDENLLSYLKKRENVELKLGKDLDHNLECDIIIRTPGMNFNSDMLKDARENGIVVTSEMELFFDFCPCKIIGVTGSDGKSTVTSIIGEFFKNSFKNTDRQTFIGGNLGTPLLPEIKKIKENDIAVVELSSFQLISMRKSPDISVITNISPNHLDVHSSMQEYIDAKKNIILHQNAFSVSVLNYDNDITKSIAEYVRGKLIFFSSNNRLQNGVWINENGDVIFSENSKDTAILNRNEIRLPGKHNLENYLAAIASVHGILEKENIKEVASKFNGIEHRMELVRVFKDVKYYNDSIATSPTRVMSGCLSMFDQKIILISGGYDKKIPFDDKFGNFINQKVKVLILFGQTAEKIEKCVKNSPLYEESEIRIIRLNDMKEAVYISYQNSEKYDIVALSPACASFGMYKNFQERGKHFKQIVNGLKEK